MRTASLWLLVASLTVSGTLVLGAQDGAVRWFSQAQAKRGQGLVLQLCAACHGARLEGRYGPPLSRDGFIHHWRGQRGTALQEFIARNMPQGQEGTLSQAQTLDVIAFILQTNGYPGGEQDLTISALARLELFVP